MGTPGTPFDDLSNASPAGKATAKLTADLLKEMGEAAQDADKIGRRWGTAIVNVQGIIGNIFAFLINIAAPAVLFFLDVVTNLRKDTVDAQVALSEATLSEFLATDVKVSGWNAGKDHASTVQAASSIGNALYNQLQTEFNIGPTSHPGPGETAARTFSGFAVNFAVQNAIISTLADALSFHELQEFRELGVGVARNLGIGRLQRMALGTLLQNVIQKPYNRELQARLRPDRLSVPEYIHARNRGDITDAQLTTALQEAGFRDQDITAVIHEYTDKLNVGEVLTLVRHGKLTEDAAVSMLQSQGMDSTTAAMRLQAAQLAIIDDNVKAYVDSLNAAVRARTIDSDTWSSLMDQVPWTDDEKQWQKLANGAYLEYYQHMLTWTQVITAYEQGIVDVTYVENWLVSKGYSQEDVLNMELLLAVKFDAFQAAADKKKAAASTPPPPKPAT